MKILLLLLAPFLVTQGFSQIVVKGIVVESDDTPLIGASVYLNSTTIGTSTDKNGAFEFEVNQGTHVLIVSFVGFITIEYALDLPLNTQLDPLRFKLMPDKSMLKEVVIRDTKYDSHWNFDLARFTNAFLGRTKLAEECKILNPRVLAFDFNPTTGTLTAYAKEPLQIKNKGLGYLIVYDLVDFRLTGNHLAYQGYARYKQLEGNKKKWKRNRLKAYNGSQLHFFKSLYTESLSNEGFVVNQFRRLPNPERPTEEEITKARGIVRASNEPISVFQKIKWPKTKLDSALVTLQKISLPKHIDYLYKKGVPYSDIKTLTQKSVLINFIDYLSVTYTREPEEENYLQSGFTSRKKTGVQTSAMVMLEKTAILNPSGIIINPLDILAEGYWSYEQFADSLPLDYQPIED